MMHFNTLLCNIVEQCNIRCRHCGFVGSGRTGRVEAEDLVDWVTQAVSYGIQQITFSGGEPFIEFDLLKRGAEAVHKSGGSSGVFTNAYWGESVETAESILGELPGLTHLHVSCDEFHLEWVPLERVLNVIRAARRLSIPQVIVCITSTKAETVAELFATERDYVDLYHSRVIPSAAVERRVPEAYENLQAFVPENYSSQCYLHSPLVHTTGNVWACHIGALETHGDMASTPYYLGNLREEDLATILRRAETNDVYQFLRAYGPRAVVEAALSSEIHQEFGARGFASDCDMCYQILPREEVLAAVRRRANQGSAKGEVFLKRVLLLGDEP